MVLKRKITKKALSQEEKYWDEVEQSARYLIADTLNQTIPLPNLRDQKNFNLDRDADYNNLLFEYENNYSEEEERPLTESLAEQLSQEIAYEYLLLVVKSLVRSLSKFDCYDPDHVETLINE